MYDDAGFIILSCIGAVAVLSSLSALIWAAVRDGRDERAFQALTARSSAVPSDRGPDPAR